MNAHILAIVIACLIGSNSWGAEPLMLPTQDGTPAPRAPAVPLGKLPVPKVKITTIGRPKPGFIVFVKQCERPLVIYGVDSALYFYTIDATALTMDQIQAIAGQVDAAHRIVTEVPCIGHQKNNAPTEL